MIRDDSYNLNPIVVLGPISTDEDNTPVAIDLRDASSAMILIGVGVGGITFTTNNKIEFKVTHSDLESEGYVPVEGKDVILGPGADAVVGTGGIVKSLIAAHAAAAAYKIGYIGGKRYIKVLADFGGSHATPTPLSVVVVQSRLHEAGVV